MRLSYQIHPGYGKKFLVSHSEGTRALPNMSDNSTPGPEDFIVFICFAQTRKEDLTTDTGTQPHNPSLGDSYIC